MELDDLERHTREQLADLEREYRARAKPLIDILVKIESCRPPKPLIIDLEDWARLTAQEVPQ